MADAVFRRESAIEFFKELVDGALARQRIHAAELTSYYVVNLLAGFLQRPAGDDDAPWRCAWRRRSRAAACSSAPACARSATSPSSCPASFPIRSGARLVDVDYYVAIGGCAYNALSRFDTDTLSPVFGELAEKFVGFVDVLSEVSERTSCSSNTDLLRLYERWLKTGSRRSGQLLVERGVVPNAGSRPVASSNGCGTFGHTSAILLHLGVRERGQARSDLRNETDLRRLASNQSISFTRANRLVRPIYLVS